MKKNILFTLLFLTISLQSDVSAQVYEGGFLCTSQSEVNEAVQILLDGGYTEMTGGLFFASTEVDNPAVIHDISGFSMLERVGGLMIRNTDSLTSLYGLHNIDSVAMSLIWITDNRELLSTSGLNGMVFHNLEHGDSEFRIENNPKLENLDGLEGITNVRGQLRIYNNPMLSDLTGLSNLHTVGHLDNSGGLFQLSHFAGSSLAGLEQLRISQDLSISLSPFLNDIEALSSLDTVGCLVLLQCDELMNIDPLNSLTFTSLNGNLSLVDCPKIQSLPELNPINNRLSQVRLRGMDNLTEITSIENLSLISTLQIVNCPALTALNTSNWKGGHLELIGNDLLTSIDISNFENSGGDISMEILDNPLLEEVVGSDSFTYSSWIQIEDNESLHQLLGFNGLDSVESVIINNPNLELISGFKNVKTIGGQYGGGITITGSLIELDAFDNLVEVIKDDLWIGASGLEYMPTFDSLRRVEGRLTISNTDLAEMDILPNLKMTIILSVGNNPNLETLTLANNLDSLGWGVDFRDHPMLTEINGFDKFPDSPTIGVKDFRLKNNTVLETTPGLCNVLAGMEEWPDPLNNLIIEGNAEGFNTTEELEAYCEELTPISETSISNIHIFPNPTSDQIVIDHIDINEVHTLAVFDGLGRETLRISIVNQQHVLDLSLYSDGLYWIALLDKKGIVLGRSSIVKLE